MSAGRISMRYAKALYKYACEQGAEEVIYGCMSHLKAALCKAKGLPVLLKNPALSLDEKVNAICGLVPQSPEFKNFITLVVRAKREDLLLFIAYSFISLYRKNKGIVKLKITTAVPLSQDTQKSIGTIFSKQEGANVELLNIVDASVIGGFICQANYKRMDASVKGQLDVIRKQLVKETRKLV